MPPRNGNKIGLMHGLIKNLYPLEMSLTPSMHWHSFISSNFWFILNHRIFKFHFSPTENCRKPLTHAWDKKENWTAVKAIRETLLNLFILNVTVINSKLSLARRNVTNTETSQAFTFRFYARFYDFNFSRRKLLKQINRWKKLYCSWLN